MSEEEKRFKNKLIALISKDRNKMFKNRGINHESQAITTTEAWLHYLSVQFQTRRRETFYTQANK